MQQNITYEYDRYFGSWLKLLGGSIIFSSKRIDAVFILSTDQDRNVTLKRHFFPKVRSIVQSRQNHMSLWISSSKEVLEMVEQDNKTVCNFTPRRHYFLGEVQCLATDRNGVVSVVTRNPFMIREIGGENHTPKEIVGKKEGIGLCALYPNINGYTFRDGNLGYMTLSREGGDGVLYGFKENKVIVSDLSYPKDCSWVDGRLYLLEAGTGYFGTVNLETGTFNRERFLPGFLRGMTLAPGCMIIGCSTDRYESTFLDMPLGDTLRKERIQEDCCIYAVSLETYDVTHSIAFRGGVIFEIDSISFVKSNNRDLHLLELNNPESFQFDIV